MVLKNGEARGEGLELPGKTLINSPPPPRSVPVTPMLSTQLHRIRLTGAKTDNPYPRFPCKTAVK